MPELPKSKVTAHTPVKSGAVELPASRPSRTGKQVASTGRRIAGLLSNVAVEKVKRAEAEVLRVEKADADRETATFQGFANEQKRLNKGYMSGNDDYETYQANWDGHIKNIDAAQSKIKNAEVKANIGNWLTKTKPVWQLEIDNTIHRGKQERANAEGQVNIREIAAGDYVAEGKALKATTKAAAEKDGREFPDRTDAEWEDTAKMNRVRQIVDSMVDTNIWTHEEGLKFETAAAKAIAAGRQKENEMAVEALIIQMGAEQGWDATIDALGDPKFLEKLAAGVGLTIGDAAEFTRDMKTLASSAKAAEDEAVKAVQEETRKDASDRERNNTLTHAWLQKNRANMDAGDYERYNNVLIKKAEKQTTDAENLRKLADVHNRAIHNSLQSATTLEELVGIQNTVDDYASQEQKKITVAKAKEWTGDIEAKRKQIIESEAAGYTEWARLSDRLTAAASGRIALGTVEIEIDRALTPPPGKDALITGKLADDLNARVETIRANPKVQARPSVARGYLRIGRLRDLQVSLLKTGKEEPVLVAGQRGLKIKDLPSQEAIIAVENSVSGIYAELDQFVNSLDPGDPQYDKKVNDKLQELTRPVVERVALGLFGTLRNLETVDKRLIQKRISTFRDLPLFKRFSTTKNQKIIELIETGLTIEEAIQETGAAESATPAGFISMISPEGERFDVPESKKQLFIDNGFREQ